MELCVNLRPEAHEEVIRDFLQAIVTQDICMEVNTSGLDKGRLQSASGSAHTGLGE